MFLNLAAWSLVGLIVGAIAGKIFKAGGDDPKLDLMVGLLGAVIGGVVAGLAGAGGVSTFNPWSLAIAPVGSVASLLAWHGLRALAARG